MRPRNGSDARLTDELATHVMRWKAFPERFITSGKDWISRSQFQPLSDIKDAFRLLERVTDDYCLRSAHKGPFIAEVRLRGRIGRATGRAQARTITLAIARLIGLETELDSGSASVKPREAKHRQRGRRDAT
ncbi:MAG: hypothetical protein ABSG41_29110 [Bryobacteraceae bacterium]